jgi:hypothetical protein
LLLSGCANGDFDRVRPSLSSDGMHDWVGRDATSAIGGTPSEFSLTDDEHRLRDLAYPLIEPPYERNQWYSIVNEYGLRHRYPRDNKPFNRKTYWLRLTEDYRRSEASAYSQINTDARNDVARLESFFKTALRVTEFDRKRAESIAYVSGTSGVGDRERDNALARNDENAAVVSWVCRSLRERSDSYRFALERLVISAPSAAAADADRALTLLQLQIGQYCLDRRGALVSKG